MRKTKRLLILSVLLVALTLSFSTAALASGEDVIPDNAVAIVEFYNDDTEYFTAEQLAGGTIFAYSTPPVTSITLLKDLTVEMSNLGDMYLGWWNFCNTDYTCTWIYG